MSKNDFMTIPIIKQDTPEEIEQRQKGMNEIFQKLNKLFLNATDTDKIQDAFKDNKKLLEELKKFYRDTTIQRVVDNIINIDTLKNTSRNGESDEDFRERKFFSSLEKFCSVQSFDTKSEGKKFENNVKKIVDKYKKDVNNRNKLWGVLEQKIIRFANELDKEIKQCTTKKLSILKEIHEYYPVAACSSLMDCLNRVITSINNCIKNLSQELDQELSQELSQEFANNKLSNELSNEVRKKVSDAMAEKLRTDRGKTEPIITNLKGALNNTADCELKKYISLKDRSEYKQIVEAIDNFFSARSWLYHKVNSLYDKISSFISEPDPNKQSLEERLYLSWLKYVSNALCNMPVITKISADLADLKNLLKDSELPKSKLDQLRFIEVIDGLSSVSEIIQSVDSAKLLFNQFICEYAEITKESKINELIAKAKALSDGILPFPVPPRPGSFSEK